MPNRHTIPFSAIDGVQVGNATDTSSMTGVTVFYFPTPARAAVSVLGGGPASRELSLIDLERCSNPIDALVFSGGSSFGLEASTGVQACLEKRGIGFDTGYAVVPLICQSSIYDLGFGSADVRPDASMGYAACDEALSSNKPASGSIGAGTGATVGKPCGMARAQKSGIGYAAARLGDLMVGVVAVVNAYGDIYHHGRKIAGLKSESGSGYEDAADALYEMQPENLFTGNTTLAAVFTNGEFSPSELKKIANMASAGMARAIRPVFTMADGDTLYALSVGKAGTKADINVAGSLAADLVEDAIADAVKSSSMADEDFLSHIRYQNG